jgi:5'-deoxynucleotidase YfbR-like HD superfamily hydrolase
MDVIAHGLAKKDRATGMYDAFVPVSEHSRLVSALCERRAKVEFADNQKMVPWVAMAGLLHDGSEAYLVDLPRPVKYMPGFEAYRALEKHIQGCIDMRYLYTDRNINGRVTEIVKWADNIALVYEFGRFLPGTCALPWVQAGFREAIEEVLESGFYILGDDSWRACKDQFLGRFNVLAANGACHA